MGGSIGSLCHCRCIQWCSSYCGNSQHLRRRKPILRCDWNDAMALWLTFFTVVATVNGFERFSRSSFSDYVIAESNSIETNTALPSIEKSSLMLSCHVCHSFVEGSKCIHLASNSSTFSTPCHDNQTSCMVKRFSYTENATSPSSIWSIERNCSSKCEPGCLILGERTKLYVCTSCCSQPSCNVGNGSFSHLGISWWLKIFLTYLPIFSWISASIH